MTLLFRHKVSLLVYTVLCAVTLLCACSSSKKAMESAQPVRYMAKPLSYNDSLRLKYFFYAADAEQNKGNYDAAFDLLQHCKTIAPDAPEVYFMLSAFYSELQLDSMALSCMKHAAELDPDNYLYQERLGITYLNMREFDPAIACYERLYASHKDRTDVLEMLLQLYNQQKNYEQMIVTLDRLENMEGENEQIALNRMHVYSMMGDKESEYNSLKELSEKHPNDLNYRVMMGNWLLSNNRDEEAKAEYDYVLEQEPQNQAALISLLDFYRTTEQDSLANELQEKLLVSSATPTNTKVTLMRRVVSDNEQMGGDSTEVLNVFKKMLAVEQKDADMIELYAAYLSLKKMPVDSINAAYSEALRIEPDNVGARLQYIQNEWTEKRFDSVIELSSQGTKYNPDQMAFYYFLGLAYYQKDERDEAFDAFQRGVSQINEESNKDFVSDFYSIMGDILHQKGRIEEAFAAYDSSLVWKEDNINTLNNYAYYLSLLDRDLQKAEKMSYTTVKAEPSNATYLDTYAWILFKQGRNSEALTYIDLTLQNDQNPQSEVLEHAGDIHAVNNDIQGAMRYWQQSLDAGNKSKTLRQKLRQKKYIKENKKK